MRTLPVLLVGCLLSSTTYVSGEQLDIDFNRLRIVPESHYNRESTNTRRRSIGDYPRQTNDHDDRSGGVRAGEAAPLRRRATGFETSSDHKQEARRVYKPREDPRQFYQSQSYLQEALAKDEVVRRQMSGVYPELATRLAGRESDFKTPELKNLGRSSRYRYWNTVSDHDEEMCVKCPAERTLVARRGVDKVLLQPPRLRTCAGGRPPRGVHFVRTYGPTFGSLLGTGSHVIVGKVAYKGTYLQDCHLRVEVVSQLCPLPSHLSSHCGGSPHCNFTCADSTLELLGASSLVCGADLRWSGDLPVCRVRTWCHSPPPPDNGQLSCQSAPTADGMGLVEGSRCRAHCQPGWRAVPRGAAVCRRGLWTHALACKRRSARHKPQDYNGR